MPNDGLHINYLADELRQQVFSFLTAAEIFSLTQSINEQHYPANNTLFWEKVYQRDFGMPPFDGDYQGQYVAAALYKKADAYLRCDLADRHFQIVFNLLKGYPSRPWTQYYLGVMYFYGHGVATDASKGLQLLVRRLQDGDYLAARELYNILCDPHQRKLFSYIHQNIQQTLKVLIKEVLLEAYGRGSYELALHLGKIAVDPYFTEGTDFGLSVARRLFQFAMKHNVKDAIREYGRSLLSEGTISATTKAIRFFKQQYELTQYPPLAYDIAALYNSPGYEDRENYLHWLHIAFQFPENAAAGRELAQYHLSENEPILAQQKLIRGFLNGDVVSMYELGNYIESGRIKSKFSAMDCYKIAARVGYRDGLQKIFEHYKDLPAHQRYEDAEAIWWVQLAAQYNIEGAFEDLLLGDDANYEFPQCAWVILDNYDLLMSGNLDDENMFGYSNITADGLALYRQAGKALDLLLPEIDVALAVAQENLEREMNAELLGLYL